MTRAGALLVAFLIALTAPAQLWCQATCAAPAQRSSTIAPHCPLHESSSHATATSGAQDQCRAPESSRSANPARAFTPIDALDSLITPSLVLPGAMPPTMSCIVDSASSTLAFHHLIPLRV